MNELHWYIAYTRSCQDKNVAAALSARGYEVFVPIRKEVRQWSDRKKVVDRLLIPHMVFVRCTELERRNSASEIPYITRYLTEKPGSYKAAIVPDSQMDAFMAMVASAGGEVALIDRPLSPGDLVRVKHGALEGKVAELVKVEGKDCLAVRLPILGSACVQIDRNSVELITK